MFFKISSTNEQKCFFTLIHTYVFVFDSANCSFQIKQS